MGIQIFIEQKDMLAAGWECNVETFTSWTQDYEGNDVPQKWPQAVFTKGDVRLVSYSHKDFSADCKHGGENRALFEELGLLKLPHILS